MGARIEVKHDAAFVVQLTVSMSLIFVVVV